MCPESELPVKLLSTDHHYQSAWFGWKWRVKVYDGTRLFEERGRAGDVESCFTAADRAEARMRARFQ